MLILEPPNDLYVLSKLRGIITYPYCVFNYYSDRLLEKLKPPEVIKFIEHLDHCAQCRNEFDKRLRGDPLNVQLKAEYEEEQKERIGIDQVDLSISPFLSDLEKTKHTVSFKPGTQLNSRFSIIRKLGLKDSPVYHATDSQRGEVALKIIVYTPSWSDKVRRELNREVKYRDLIDNFSHIIKPNDIHEIVYEGVSLVLFSMQYANGGSLRDWLIQHLHDHKKRLNEGINLFEQACMGIQTLHGANIIHRDIKPENILLCRSNEDDYIVKLSDFGISWRQLGSISEAEESYFRAGTFQYMSPEQFQGRAKEIGPASDIYSLGVVLFEILEGKLPFEGDGFEEMRDKHTHQPQPPLNGDLSRWDKIIGRCLKKEPSARYPDTDTLLNEIVRLRSGYSLSADVACPKCNHINNNPRVLECEKCKESLPESLFRKCPRCKGSVRLDQEDCPHCGRRGVAAYYLLEDRKEQVEQLKDVNPLGAIAILEAIFLDGTGDYARRAEELITDLRQKQHKISSWELQAKKSTESGELEKALEIWGRVLGLIPRHEIALEKVRELEEMLDTLKRNDNQADRLMEAADFIKAEELLLSCMEIAPNRKGLTDKFRQCQQRRKKYKKAYDLACQLAEQRLLLQAEREIKKALKQAPKSSEAQSLSDTVSSGIRDASDLVKKLNSHIEWAQFENADETSARIEQIQADNTPLPEIKRRFQKIRKQYTAAMTDAETATKSRDLIQASEKITKALNLCPHSTEAKGLMDQVEADKRDVLSMLKDCDVMILAAEFIEAMQILGQIEKAWKTATNFAQKRKDISATQTEHSLHYKKANEAKQQAMLDIAKQEVEISLSICPQSAKTQSLLSLIEKAMQRAKKLLGKAESLIKSAKFSEAKDTLDMAKKDWCTIKGLEASYIKLNNVQKEYDLHIDAACHALDEGNLDEAKGQLESAISLCPDSNYVDGLLSKVVKLQNNALEHLSIAKKSLSAAQFKGASEQVGLARNLWCTCPGLDEQGQRIGEIEQQYTAHIAKSKELLSRKQYKDALSVCNEALEMCNNSEPAKDLKNTIQVEIANRLRLKQERDDYVDGIFLAIGSFFKGIGVGIFWIVRGIAWISLGMFALTGNILRVIFEGSLNAFESNGKSIMIVIAIIIALVLVTLGGIWLFTTEEGHVTLIGVVLFGGIFLTCFFHDWRR